MRLPVRSSADGSIDRAIREAPHPRQGDGARVFIRRAYDDSDSPAFWSTLLDCESCGADARTLREGALPAARPATKSLGNVFKGLRFSEDVGIVANSEVTTVFRVEEKCHQRLFIDAHKNVKVPEVLTNKGRVEDRNHLARVGQPTITNRHF